MSRGESPERCDSGPRPPAEKSMSSLVTVGALDVDLIQPGHSSVGRKEGRGKRSGTDAEVGNGMGGRLSPRLSLCRVSGIWTPSCQRVASKTGECTQRVVEGLKAVALGDGGQLWFFIKGLIGSTNYVCV